MEEREGDLWGGDYSSLHAYLQHVLCLLDQQVYIFLKAWQDKSPWLCRWKEWVHMHGTTGCGTFQGFYAWRLPFPVMFSSYLHIEPLHFCINIWVTCFFVRTDKAQHYLHCHGMPAKQRAQHEMGNTAHQHAASLWITLCRHRILWLCRCWLWFIPLNCSVKFFPSLPIFAYTQHLFNLQSTLWLWLMGTFASKYSVGFIPVIYYLSSNKAATSTHACNDFEESTKLRYLLQESVIRCCVSRLGHI